MYYEINVSLNGVHFFATDERSCKFKSKLEELLKVFRVKFPESEGYKITVTEWQTLGHPIDVSHYFEE